MANALHFSASVSQTATSSPNFIIWSACRLAIRPHPIIANRKGIGRNIQKKSLIFHIIQQLLYTFANNLKKAKQNRFKQKN